MREDPKKPRRFLRAKLLAAGVLLLAGLVAYEGGYLGWSWAELKAHTFPKDEALLANLPADTRELVVVDTHLLKIDALGPRAGLLPAGIDRVRQAIKKTFDVDLGRDVDKLVVTPALVVARGRFSGKKLADKLAELHYAPSEHKGVFYMAKRDEDAVAVLRDELLFWGDEAALKAAIDAREGGATLDKDEAVMGRLEKVGWKHAVLVAYRLNDDKPSVRSIVSGAQGTRAITVALAPGEGVDVDAVVEDASAPGAQELDQRLEAERQSADALAPRVGKDMASAIAPAAKRAALSVDGGDVRVHTHVPAPELDAIARAAGEPGPVLDALRTFKFAR